MHREASAIRGLRHLAAAHVLPDTTVGANIEAVVVSLKLETITRKEVTCVEFFSRTANLV